MKTKLNSLHVTAMALLTAVALPTGQARLAAQKDNASEPASGDPPIVEPQKVAEQRKQATQQKEKDIKAVKGRKLYNNLGCVSCHSVDGSRGMGPTWKGIMGRNGELSDGSKYTVTEDFIRESISTPGAKVKKGYSNMMPSFKGRVNDAQIEELIAYMKTL